uniref:GRF-type domain-containing protein n=1 Tax=Chenopodium quinoa TaxID=63459 RepID=A0A803N245_CHEQI
MATSDGSVGSGARSRSRGNSSPIQVYCYHDDVAPLRTVRHNGPTKGKRFYGCSYWPEQRTCDFFKWYDEVDDVKVLQHRVLDKISRISELEDENECLREKVKKLKAKRRSLWMRLQRWELPPLR